MSLLSKLGETANYVSRIFGKQMAGALDELNDYLIGFDPQTATQVEIDRLRKKLEEFSHLFIEATNQLEKEKNDIVALQKNIDKNLAALRILSNKAEALEDGSSEKILLLEQATTINQTLDELEATLPIEQQEAAYAAEYFDTVQKLLNESEAKLKQAVRARSQVEHNLKMANLRKQSASVQLEQARNLEALGGEINQDNGVFVRAQKVAEKQLNEAKGMELAAEKLNNVGNLTGKNLADQILAESEPNTETKDPFSRLKKITIN